MPIPLALNAKERPRIYQLMVRHFGNTNETRRPHGTIEENGCGKFEDIDEVALRSLRELGVSHLWLTGVLEHASRTDYPQRPADTPEVVKGQAGSPYAIRDYFDVSPDYAVEPVRRLTEFRDLLGRCQRQGLKVLLDFVPNHVSRSYQSDVRPELSFGTQDVPGQFFRRDNNFYYLSPEEEGGPPLRLPVLNSNGGEQICFEPERQHGRVTGNNVCSWSPSALDWYETVKLNYGHDFTVGRDTSHLPGPTASSEDVPDTWRKMDLVLEHWQRLGVDGFRVDMAHMVPMEFWRWALRRARSRDPEAYFLAEAYEGDPAKLTEGNVLEALLGAGFDSVYDIGTYQLIQQIYEGPKWANDIDRATPRGERFYLSARFAENHDEVRLASPLRWGGLGMKVGRPVSAILFGMGSGPVMVYNGQEVGEAAEGTSGFSSDDGRSSIFDYGSLPELSKWVNKHHFDGGKLAAEQRELRQWYQCLLEVSAEPAFVAGEFLPLNEANLDNPHFGRLPGEAHSGHWLYAFLRFDRESGHAVVVLANLHGEETLRDIHLLIPRDYLLETGHDQDTVSFRDRLGSDWASAVSAHTLWENGLRIEEMGPCTAMYLEMR